MRCSSVWFAWSVCALGVLISLVAQPAAAESRTFKVDASGSRIQFVSDAPLERITGVSSGARGGIVLDPQTPAQAQGEIRVKVASIRTNQDLRDEHLRSENWLDAARYPDIVFTLSRVSGVAALKPDEAAEATVSGRFALHGVTHDLETKARVRWVPAASGDTLRVQASFTVKLEAYKVSIPSIVSLKVSPNIQVNIDVRATAAPQALVPMPVPVPVAVVVPVPEADVQQPASAPPAETPPVKRPKPAAARTAPAVRPQPAQPAQPAQAKPTVPPPAHASAASAPATPAAPLPFDAQRSVRRLRRLLKDAREALSAGETERSSKLLEDAHWVLRRIDRKLFPPMESAP